MINGVILSKLEVLDRALVELRSLGQVSAAQIRQNWLLARAIERNLQILVEIVIDVCQRLLALTKQTPATSGIAALDRCVALGALSDNEAYRQMVRFRNFIVHRYDHIDETILSEVMAHRLGDFEQFKGEILAYVQREGGK